MVRRADCARGQYRDSFIHTLVFVYRKKCEDEFLGRPAGNFSKCGFHVEFGNVFLLRRGEYEVVVTAEGYETFSSKFEVNDERNQTLFFELTPTPGLLSIKVTPEDALFQVEGSPSMDKSYQRRARTASSCGCSRI